MNAPALSGETTGDLSPFGPAAGGLAARGRTQTVIWGRFRGSAYPAPGKAAGITRSRLEKDRQMGNPGLRVLEEEGGR